MSLMKTLAKVAIGVAIAKGVSKMAQGGAAQAGQTSDDGLFRGRHSPGQTDAQAGTPLEGMMDSILGGGQQQERGSSGKAAPGGLGGLLEQLGGSAGPSGGARSSGGGLEDLLGGLAGGAGGAGGLGGLLGGLAGALQGGQQAEGSFGEVLNSQFDSTPEPARQPTADQEAAAGLMLTAMLQAAKADGRFDRDEQAKLMERLGDVSREERDFVNATLQKPVDIDGLARAVPRGMEPQVYMMSVLGIDLDSQEEAQYLHNLAKAMGIDKANVNHIHDRMGVPRIYR